MARSSPIHWVLLLAVVAAGCAAPTQPPDATVPPLSMRFHDPVDLGQGGPEPVIVWQDNHVYVAAQDPRGGGPRFWVSKDGGATFTSRRPTTQGGGEVDLAAGPDGAVYLTQLGVYGNIVSVSHDHGTTWRTAPLGAQTQYFDREWLAVDARGSAYVVAREFGANHFAGIARSDDRGTTWIAQGRPWDAAHEPGVANGNLITAGDALHLVYVCHDGSAVCVATSTDRGVTWTQSVAAARSARVNHVYPSIARTSSGLVVSWADASSGRLAVYTAWSATGTGAWSAPVRVSVEGETAALSWIAARGDVTWVVFLGADVALAATDDPASEGAAWSPLAVRLDARGRPLETPVALMEDAVHHGPISPPVGRPGSARTQDRNFGDFFTAAIDGNGKLLVAVSKDLGTAASTRDVVIRER